MGDRNWSNFSSCCRLCLSEKFGTLKSIFEDVSRSEEIVRNIELCLGVEVRPSDRLSTMICQQCLSKVNSWYDYRRFCHENQSKLETWMNAWSSANMGIQIKDEVIEDGENNILPPVVVEDDEVMHIKSEPMDTTYDQSFSQEDIYGQPPPLTPHPPDEELPTYDSNVEDSDGGSSQGGVNMVEGGEMNGLEGTSSMADHVEEDGRRCRFCVRVFSTVGNRRKHENMIHRRQQANERLQRNDPLSDLQNGEGPSEGRSETEMQKIQFAAGLQLQQRSSNSSQVPIENTPLTKVEVSYLEKCKAIVTMTETLVCVCHDERFEDVKELNVHLKKQRTWFAMFTCYNCLITFGDRSSYMKHYCNCPKSLLESLKRLSESPVNPDVKIRLYQSYKCVRCKSIFSFREDYLEHLDEDHLELMQDNPPFMCACSKTFNAMQDYKQHVHFTCFLRFFCDVCFKAFPSIEKFKEHCEKEHDSAEGSTLESYDTFHKGRPAQEASWKRKSLPANNNKAYEGRKRRRTITLPLAPDLEPEDPDYTPEPHKVINPHALYNMKSAKPTACPSCKKVYSSYHNMLRHYKMSHDKTGKLLQCRYCPDRFRLITELKEHEGMVHRNEPRNTERDPLETSEQCNFSCPVCGDLFKSRQEWQEHTEQHPKLSCTECGKQFLMQAELDQHRSVHLNLKVYRDSKTQDYKSTMVSPTLICEVCDKTFTSKSEMQQHQMLHKKMPVLNAQDETVKEEKKDLTKKYSCFTCNKHYISYGGIWDHNKRYHSSQESGEHVYPRQCNLCPKVLSSKGAYGNHRRMHERLQAQQDAENRPNKPGRSSSDKTDDGESYYTCKRCFKVFSSKYNLRNHMKCHGIVLNPSSRSSSKTGKIIKTYWCDVCHQACPGYAELQEHKLEHRNEQAPELTNEVDQPEQKKPVIFCCNICTSTFTTNFALRRHKEKHAQEDEGTEEEGSLLRVKSNSVYCKYCKIPFEDVEELNDHMLTEHEQSLTKLKHHMQKSSGKKFPCGLCKKVFDNAGALSSHQGWHKRGKFGKKILRSQEKVVRTMLNQVPNSVSSPDVNKYQCYNCYQQFSNDTALQLHILEKHRNVDATVLNCNACKLSFETRSSYDAHLQLHRVVENQKSSKPHPCQFCTAGFSRSDTLNAHIKQHHKEYYQDIFKCNQCDRMFDKQNALTIHLKVHDKQRSNNDFVPRPNHNKNMYFCSICDLGFVIAKDLRNHVVTAHPF